jgi:murein DD-endopeptidase MepM/ murein hydrolase activator NlpD
MFIFFQVQVLYSINWTNYIMEVFLTNMKNWFKKSSRIFDKEGFYIVLFVCLCIVAVAAVFISRRNADIAKDALQGNKGTQYTEPDNSKEVVDNSGKDDDAAPVVNTPVDNKNDDKNSASDDKSGSNSGSTTDGKNVWLKMPVQGDITKEFSKDTIVESLTLGQWETHEGMDIACDIGSEITAAADGKVVEVRTEDSNVDPILKTGYGISVIIEHSNGLRTVYSNLAETSTDEDGNVVSAIKVKTGDVVKCGDVIGIAGDTAVREMVSIEGSHLHFEVLNKINGEYQTVDPKEYIK